MSGWLPRIRLFGWHGDVADADNPQGEAAGILMRITWRSWVAEISLGRVRR